MDASEFEAFRSTLENFVSNQAPGNVKVHSCQISEEIVLLDCEKKIVEKAIPKRVYEFSAGRRCARKCLSFFGMENCELLKGEFGEPLWPDGITGSITHHSGMAIAVSMPLSQGYIGIDIVNLSEDLPNPQTVLTDADLECEFGEDIQNRELLLFSLKESVIKIISPLLHEYVEFKDVEIKFDNKGLRVSFRAESLNIKLLWLYHGHYAFTMAIMHI